MMGAAAALTARSASAAAERPCITELFTSQGCSSCPPADAFMTELRSMKDVIALTYNVDYWDYLGWRDTLASPAHSQRQYDYAKARGDMDVYTPQLIVDGGSHYVGSNKAEVMAAIRRSLASTPSLWVPMSLTGNSTEVAIEIGASSAKTNLAATVWLVSVAPEITVKIEKGENAGKDMIYYNVVRKLTPAGMWNGEAASLTMPREGVVSGDCKGGVALLQLGSQGHIIGASTWGALS
ncbi:DUF1223 domain-containing protein [soil metagenome]